MPLEGSLEEFALPDIFQLISQQQKTGKLVLKKGDDAGFILFDHGMIVASRLNQNRLLSYLFKYVVLAKNFPQKEIEELIEISKGNIKKFSTELVSNGYIDQEELAEFVYTIFEDITGSFFLWDSGRYRFEQLKDVKSYIIADVHLPADATIMETMRRVDELRRIQEHLTDKTVFVRKVPRLEYTTEELEYSYVVQNMASHLFTLIDGSTNVEELIRGSYVPEFLAYELLSMLWNEQKIVPTTYRFTVPQRAHKIENEEDQNRILWVSVSALVGAIVMCCILFLGLFYTLSPFATTRRAGKKQYASVITALQAEQKLGAATLWHTTRHGGSARSIKELQQGEFLTERDVRSLLHTRRLKIRQEKLSDR